LATHSRRALAHHPVGDAHVLSHGALDLPHLFLDGLARRLDHHSLCGATFDSGAAGRELKIVTQDDLSALELVRVTDFLHLFLLASPDLVNLDRGELVCFELSLFLLEFFDDLRLLHQRLFLQHPY